MWSSLGFIRPIIQAALTLSGRRRSGPLEMVVAPEQLVADLDRRDARDPSLDRAVRELLEALLDLGPLDGLGNLSGVEAGVGGCVGEDLGVAQRAARDEDL